VLTITHLTTQVFLTREHASAVCDIRVKLNEPVQMPVLQSRPDGDRVEVTSFWVSIDRALDTSWPLAVASSYIKAGGYVLTKKGTRNKTTGWTEYLTVMLNEELVTRWLAEVDRMLVVARRR
jgi:hypothetical protein